MKGTFRLAFLVSKAEHKGVQRMKKSIIGLFIAMWSGTVTAGQDPVLMRVNGREVLRSEFEYFCRQKQAAGQSPAGKLDFYLDLFIAHTWKMEPVASMAVADNDALREEQSAYRRQLIRSYLTDEGTEEECARRLYDRMYRASHPWKVRVMQIYRRLPQNITSQSLQEIQHQMETVYEAIKNNPATDFEALVKINSDDKVASWVSGLQMPAEFEEVVFSMKKGEISRPFLSPNGIHIVKVLEREELPPFHEMRDKLAQQFAWQYRANEATETFVRKMKEACRYTPDPVGMEELLSKGATSRILFTLNGEEYNGAHFKLFAAAHPMGIKKQLDAFIAKSVLDYENRQLEEKHPEFRSRLQEHKEQLMSANIVKKDAREVTLADSVALKDYFRKNRSKYEWETARFKGAVLYCVNKKIGKRARKLLKELPPYSWEDAIRLSFNSVSPFIPVHIEQGVFAEGDNEFIDKLVFKKGDTPRTKSYPFTAVLGEKIKRPVYYREVLDQLINDYQNHLDLQQAKHLRAAGKVEINQEVLKTVNNH